MVLRRIVPNLLCLILLFLALSVDPGAAIAQTEGLSIQINRLDSAQFPTVTTYLTVTDWEGNPVTGLSATDFGGAEAGRPIETAAIEVIPDAQQPLSLVLAVDLSVPAESFSTVIATLNALLDQLQPQDQVALITFADQALLSHTFTTDRSALRRILADLEPAGNFTALNQAADLGLKLSLEAPPGRPAVLIFTNSNDNTASGASGAISSPTRPNDLPVYLFGFGSRVEQADLESLAQAGGGRAYLSAGADGIATNLNSLLAALRQGYRVIHRSTLSVSNSDYDLQWRVSHAGRQGSAQGQFRVPGHPITVSLAGLTDAQVVTGELPLAPEIEASHPIAAVEYRLDDQVLGRVETPPYTFHWDSAAVAPGRHTLTAHVVDRIGNEGHTAVTVDVKSPLTIELFTAERTVQIGDKVIVEVSTGERGEIAAIDFSLDGQPLRSESRSPYLLVFDSSPYPAGEHILTARARDRYGQAAEARLGIALLAPIAAEPTALPASEATTIWQAFPLSEPDRWGPFLAKVSGLLAGLMVVGVILVRRPERRRFHLQITNQGNVRSRYVLRAADQHDRLQFDFLLHNQQLPRRRLPSPATSTHFADQTDQGNQLDFGDLDDLEPEDADRVRTSGGLLDRAVDAAEMGGVIGEILYLIGSLLPRSLRTPIQQIGSRIRRGRSAVHRIDRAAKRARKFRPSANEAGVGSMPHDQSAPTPAAELWFQTPYIAPGHTQTVELTIKQRGVRYTGRRLPFHIYSRSIEIDAAPLVTTPGDFIPARSSGSSRLLRFAALISILVLLVLLCSTGYSFLNPIV